MTSAVPVLHTELSDFHIVAQNDVILINLFATLYTGVAYYAGLLPK